MPTTRHSIATVPSVDVPLPFGQHDPLTGDLASSLRPFERRMDCAPGRTRLTGFCGPLSVLRYAFDYRSTQFDYRLISQHMTIRLQNSSERATHGDVTVAAVQVDRAGGHIVVASLSSLLISQGFWRQACSSWCAAVRMKYRVPDGSGAGCYSIASQ